MEEAKGCMIAEDVTIKATILEMRGVREENARLKNELRKIEEEYKTLQMQYTRESKRKNVGDGDDEDDQEERELVSLRLGTNSNVPTDLGLGCSPERTKTDDDGPAHLGKGPSLSPDNSHSSTGKKEEDTKGMKTKRDEEISQTSVKRARVCVRARCDTPTMNDGCQWRKYGQKIAKGNPCPRAYYRCTVSTSCPVRKQVQRCMQDVSILITTYEGTHNHPLPISAAAMASTTSAAASMLVSGSSTSPSLNLRGPPPFHYNHLSFSPNYSTTTPFSTVTLDLTTNPNAAAAAAHGGFSLYPPQNPRIPAAGQNNFPNYSNTPPAHEQKYLSSYLEKFNQASSQQALTETLTKAITSDPSFRSVIAAAISTMAAANGGAGEKY